MTADVPQQKQTDSSFATAAMDPSSDPTVGLAMNLLLQKIERAVQTERR